MKKIAWLLVFLVLFVLQIESPTSLYAETKDAPLSEKEKTQPPKMSESEFFIAIQMPEYSEYKKKAAQLYNEDKYKESAEISKKLLNLCNERHEAITEGCKKYGATKAAQKIFECMPIFQLAVSLYGDAAATPHEAHIMEERYFMLFKSIKLYEYFCAEYPDNTTIKGYQTTAEQLLSNATKKSHFPENVRKAHEALAKSYDFTKEEMRTLKNVVEFLDKADKIAKEYKPKAEAS